MIDSIINCASPDDADALILGVPYERGASFGVGASQGPRAIVACLDRQIELFERHTRTEPANRYRIAHRMLDEVGVLPPEEMVARVADALLREWSSSTNISFMAACATTSR
jgi:arginase family enzyme